MVVQFLGTVGQGNLPNTHGGVAQLGEHLPCKQGVNGSSPFISTMTTFLWSLGIGLNPAFYS